MRVPALAVIALSTLILLAGCTALRRPATRPEFRAGAATVDISPPTLPVRIAGGFLEGAGREMKDPLHVRSLVLDDGRTRLALVVVDTCMMPRDLIDEAKRLAHARCGIPIDHLTISATHTHSAPAAMSCLGTRADPAYQAWLPGKIAEGIAAAAANLQPARIGWASVDDWQHTHNRRWIRRTDRKIKDPFGADTALANMHPGYLSPDVIGPSGPVDPELSVLVVRTRAGRPLAVWANYSQHYFGAPAVSADYYGHFCRHLARLLEEPGEGNGPFVAAMTQGTSGDLMWMDYGAPKSDLTLDRYAAAVAASAARAVGRASDRDHAALGIVERRLPLAYRVPDEARLAWARPIAAGIVEDRPKDRTEVYAREAILLHERPRTELLLQAIRIGDLTIAALPNEVYALTGLKLKARAPGGAHFNIELANGAEGYIPPPEQHHLGGYTTWPARTAGLEVQAEPKIVEALVGALEQVTGRPRRVERDEPGPYARAILAARPVAYWRLNDADGGQAANAVPGGRPARLRGGFAWYLPGVGTGSGTGAGEVLQPSAFSGPHQLNRAIHVAGGELSADVGGGKGGYSAVLWFWLGERSGASDRDGVLVRAPGGETLRVRQDQRHDARLAFGETTAPATFRADAWHCAVLVRDGDRVQVHVDGQAAPALALELPASAPSGGFVFGRGLQGKLDEIAVFDRALTAAEIAGLWRESGLDPRE
ncbi:MAG: hypothetical protein HZC55_07750 [Verrucomicrobia bacterium]|nr:hypothetical protein [Verrucomicrobiota bacterium]